MRLQMTQLCLKMWEKKVNSWWNTSSQLVPVDLRVRKITEPTPAIVLCDYETTEVGLDTRPNDECISSTFIHQIVS